MVKVKLFTHTDLDGIGCAVVAKTAFKDVEVTYCDYVDVNEKILDFLENSKVTDYDRIFITDISVSEEVAERLDLIHRGGVSTVNLIDHHGTALWLAERYSWCEVRVEESDMYPVIPTSPYYREKVGASGTSLFYKFLRNKHLPSIARNEKLKIFAETVRRYDCWEWHNIYKDDHPKELNDLLWIIGREKFVERFSSSPLPTFTDTELTLLEIEQHRINKYIWNKKQEVKFDKLTLPERSYNVAYVFAEQNVSLLGNAIAEEYGEEIDFVAIFDIGNNKVSLRGKHDNIDLGKDIARKYFSGGGHAKAGGFEINEILQIAIVRDVLLEGKYKKEDR